MAHIIVENVAKLFQTDTYLYACMSSRSLSFQEYMMDKHGWNEGTYLDYKGIYHTYLLKQTH